MKKVLFGLLIASFGAGAFAQTLVYDYKASIKRLNANYKLTKNQILNSYNVVSDTIEGYIQVPVCKACLGSGVTGGMDKSIDVNDADYWLTRKGDAYSKKAGLPTWYYGPATVQSAIFGASLDVSIPASDPNFGKPIKSLNDAKSAWMALDYTLGMTNAVAATEKLDAQYINKKFPAGEELYYDALGVDNSAETDVQSTGFGAVNTLKGSEVSKMGWCGGSIVKTPDCRYIKSIDGTLVGYTKMSGACDQVPMWDLCDEAQVADAVITGTWSLKYNNKLSNGDTAAQQAAIMAKIGSVYTIDVH